MTVEAVVIVPGLDSVEVEVPIGDIVEGNTVVAQEG